MSILFLVSCKDKPTCTLPDDRLIQVLVDIQIAEAAAQSLVQPVKDSVLAGYYQQVFVIHKVEEDQFRNCYEELQNDPDRMTDVYNRVLEELSRMEAQSKEE
ncbi:MAG: DUF4296 domain-containing protein [Saprospirales bacterium]|nr:DUF4296 domain-containing protein [Saprospirales bacterium]MBK8492278.1 DUF4296 domain-containing protein [Saprospirales bacterium]